MLRTPRRPLPLVLGALALGALGACGALRPPPLATVEAPGWDAARAARLTAEAAARPDAAGWLAARLRRAGLQPAPVAGAAGGFVAGRYPLRASELVVVAAPLGGAPEDRAALAELAHALGALARARKVPERTVLVAGLPGDAAALPAALRRLLAGPLWPADADADVLVLGGAAPEGPAAGAPVVVAVGGAGDAGARARAAYDALLPHVYALGAPSDSLERRALGGRR